MFNASFLFRSMYLERNIYQPSIIKILIMSKGADQMPPSWSAGAPRSGAKVGTFKHEDVYIKIAVKLNMTWCQKRVFTFVHKIQSLVIA